MRKVELLPTRDGEAGYGPDYASLSVLSVYETFLYLKMQGTVFTFIMFMILLICCFFLFFLFMFSSVGSVSKHQVSE